MNGGPWHCGFPMEAVGGYQMEAKPWLSFKCTECGHDECVFGKVTVHNGVETFHPAKRKVLTVLMHHCSEGVLCRGICEDETIFDNGLCPSPSEAVETLGRFYNARGYRVVFDLPER